MFQVSKFYNSVTVNVSIPRQYFFASKSTSAFNIQSLRDILYIILSFNCIFRRPSRGALREAKLEPPSSTRSSRDNVNRIEYLTHTYDTARQYYIVGDEQRIFRSIPGSIPCLSARVLHVLRRLYIEIEPRENNARKKRPLKNSTILFRVIFASLRKKGNRE